MIRQIKVDGFRTLSDFTLDLLPGLNILLGPNGGGKTTIIMFFSFINDIYSKNLSEAISTVGGAGHIFRKKGADDYQRTISAEIRGTVNIKDIDYLPTRARNLLSRGKFIDYKYTFSIELSADREDVYYNSQELVVRRSKRRTSSVGNIKKWDYKFSRTRTADGTVISTAESEHPDVNSIFDFTGYAPRGKNLASTLDQFLDPEDSLLHAARFLGTDVHYSFAQNFGRRVLYNPQPESIRQPEDSAKSPGIRPDGSGLYASLLAIKRKKTRAIRAQRPINRDDIPFIRATPLERLEDYFRLAFPALFSIDVTNDPFDNQIRARVTIDTAEGPQLPLASLSDGTLKWMSLATALITTRHVIGIEEPENFIHPNVQGHALQLIRESTREDSFVLVSSHSQSIMDAARPGEIVFVQLDGSKTRASRIKDPEAIADLINESGFGLSFFYMSGALQDA
ncbi:AAA family ATPase [Paraburkholderia sp. LEh10]|uniref:AAA family ATPase n=1 Tax=Paraburkholderia sp. LEh10 TaxID=2821353 RepID=UPI001AE5CA8C|nr:AAA family ATPase [Paraburkholderia sp. LEh10]MBP0594576.1 AAA family ATPase [Paraburkholderia sp. LEh10]